MKRRNRKYIIFFIMALLIILIIGITLYPTKKIILLSQVSEKDKLAATEIIDGLEYEKIDGEQSAKITGYTGTAVDLTIPSSIKFSGDDTTYNVTTIGENAFYDCTSIESITMSDSITNIENWAFMGCTNLWSINISKNVQEIRASMFHRCTSLEQINVDSENSVYKSINGVVYTKDLTEIVYVPIDIVYDLDANNNITYTIPDEVTKIGSAAFRGSKIQVIDIPDTVTEVDTMAFANCELLEQVELSTTMTSISQNMFANCILLSVIDIPSNITSIGQDAFQNCEKLPSIGIPNNITEIGNGAFRGCTGLTAVYISNMISEIPSRAFSGCTNLENITIAKSATNNPIIIGPQAFENCTSLKKWTVPSMITSIREGAFQGCTGLESIKINKNVTDIGQDVFKDCTNLTINCYSDSAAYQYAATNSINYILLDGLNSIAVTKKPTKTEYIQNSNQELDLTGGEITLTYNDGTTSIISMTTSGVTTSGFDKTTTGEKTITVAYQDKIATFNVTIVPKSVTNMVVTKEPKKTEYIQNSNQELDLTGGEITLTYNDGTTSIISMTTNGVTTSGFDKTTTGEKTITLTYQGKTATFKVTVVAKDISNIAVTKNPAKTEYIQNSNQTLDLMGGEITLTYNDGTTSIISMTTNGVTTSVFDTTTTGEKTITVTYQGKTATFKVTVAAKNITNIEVTKNPTKTEYIQNSNQELDLTGGEITLTYNDGTTDTISMTTSGVTTSEFDKTTTGEKTITVTYQGKTATFKVTVIAKNITNIEVTKNPTKTEYIQNSNQELDLTGGEITLTYDDGTTDTISMTTSGVTTSGFDTTATGEKTITVEYQGKTATFKISIKMSSDGNGSGTTGGNEIVNGNNNSEISSNKISTNKSTTATGNLPKTGSTQTIILSAMVITIVSGLIFYIKYKRAY